MSRITKWILVLGLTSLPACGSDLKTGPGPDEETPADPAILARAFRLDINVETGEVAVLRPGQAGQTSLTGPMRSLLGSEVVGIAVSNFFRSPIGQFVKNKRTIKIDLVLTNRLSVTDLVTPTFPIPPAGVQGVLAFPYTVAAFGVAGGKATPDTTWNGTGALPSGAPFNFFNDLASCPTGTTSDCYRWESFGTVLTPGSSSTAHRVGFTVDPGVTTIQIYVVVAADLLDHPPIPPVGKGAVLGVVSSPTFGLLSGVTVAASPNGATAATDGLGKYVLTGLDAGTTLLSVSALPAGCTNPGGQQVVVTSGGVTTANFSLACVPPPGSITGIVTTPDRHIFAGVTVSALVGPEGCGGSVIDATGNYSLECPPGSAVVSLSTLPAGCTDPGNQTVTVAAGSPVTADFVVRCTRLFGSISGTATSPQGVPMKFIALRINNWIGSFTEISSDANGVFGYGPILAGPSTITLKFLPAGCIYPGTFPIGDIPVDGNLVVDISVDCSGPVGTVSGLVSSPELGPLALLPLSNNEGGYFSSAVTDPTGHFTFPRIIAGPTFVSLSSVPPFCVFPPMAPVTVVAGADVVVNFSVDCSAAVTPVPMAGLVNSPELGRLSGVAVQVLDSHGGVDQSTVTVHDGTFLLDLLPGSYQVVLADLPPGCQDPGSQTVFIFPGSAPTPVFTVTCS